MRTNVEVLGPRVISAVHDGSDGKTCEEEEEGGEGGKVSSSSEGTKLEGRRSNEPRVILNLFPAAWAVEKMRREGERSEVCSYM